MAMFQDANMFKKNTDNFRIFSWWKLLKKYDKYKYKVKVSITKMWLTLSLKFTNCKGLLLLGSIIYFEVSQVQERTNSTPNPKVWSVLDNFDIAVFPDSSLQYEQRQRSFPALWRVRLTAAKIEVCDLGNFDWSCQFCFVPLTWSTDFWSKET